MADRTHPSHVVSCVVNIGAVLLPLLEKEGKEKEEEERRWLRQRGLREGDQRSGRGRGDQ